MAIDRYIVIDAIRGLAEQTPWIAAAWIGGSDATGRTDEFSDIDLQLIVPDEHVEDAFAEIEELLVTLGGIAHRWRLPEPIWHGHSQAVYKPTFTSDFLSLDLVVMARSSNNWYIEKERHGDIVVLVDREGLLNSPPLDHEELMRLRKKMIEHHVASQPVILEVVAKAIARGHRIEAGIRYHSRVLKTLIELMRCEHCPERFDYGERYLDRDLPIEERTLIEELSLPGSLEDLAAKFTRARLEIEKRLRRLGDPENSRGDSEVAIPSPT